MNVSFDGLRKNLARSFNEVCRNIVDGSEEDIEEALMDLRSMIGALLACYDPSKQPEDFNMLADEVKLSSFGAEEDE